MKKPKFSSEILVGKEGHANGESYDVVLGTPSQLKNLSAEDGDWLAIYRLVKVHRLETNPRLR